VLGHEREKIQSGVPLEIQYLRPPALGDFDETDLLEPLQAFPYDVPIDAEDFGQRALSRQTRTRRVALGHDLAGELLEHLVG